MKILLFILIWILGYLISVFLFMLISRLSGEDPDDVYGFDEDYFIIYAGLLALWPLGLFLEILLFVLKFFKKWFVFAIETIVAIKERREDESNSSN